MSNVFYLSKRFCLRFRLIKILFWTTCIYLIAWAVACYRAEKLFKYPLTGERRPEITGGAVSLGEGKRFAFRVNSVDRLKKVQGRYDGYESDVIFKDGKFLLGHWEHELGDFYLEKMLRHFPKPFCGKFWVDLKNLSEENREAVVKRLSYLVRKYGLKDRIVLESPNVAVLSRMRGRGFYTSYYLPYPNRYAPTQADAAVLAATLKKYPVDGVSSYAAVYPFMNYYFPNVPLFVWWWAPWHRFFYTGWIDARLEASPQIRAVITKD